MDGLFRDSLSESDFLYNPDGGACHSHSASILEAANGDLFATWYAYPESENIDAALILARRRLGAKTWEPSRLVLKSAAYSLGNPVLHQRADGSLALLHVVLRDKWWNSAVIHVIVSSDEGRTWSQPTSLGLPPGLMIRHAPVTLANSDLLLPAYDETRKQTLLLRASPPYRQWDVSHSFEQCNLIQPVLLNDARGGLKIYFRAGAEPCRVWHSHSRDEGATWAAPEPTALVNPLSGIAAIAAHGVHAVVHNPVENQRTPLAISLSPTAGRSWGPPRVLDSAKFEVSYPAFILGRDQMIRGVYTFNRRMIKYVAFPASLLRHGQS